MKLYENNMELDNCIELVRMWVDYLDGSDFLSLFFELFTDLMKVIGVIC